MEKLKDLINSELGMVFGEKDVLGFMSITITKSELLRRPEVTLTFMFGDKPIDHEASDAINKTLSELAEILRRLF